MKLLLSADVVRELRVYTSWGAREEEVDEDEVLGLVGDEAVRLYMKGDSHWQDAREKELSAAETVRQRPAGATESTSAPNSPASVQGSSPSLRPTASPPSVPPNITPAPTRTGA